MVSGGPAQAAAASAPRGQKRVVVTTQQQRVVKTNASSESRARGGRGGPELSSRMRGARAGPRRSAAWGPGPTRGGWFGARFRVAEEDSTDDEAGEDERRWAPPVAVAAGAPARALGAAVTSTALYDVETIRREREAKEALEVERTKLEKEKRQVKEQAWAEASERVERRRRGRGLPERACVGSPRKLRGVDELRGEEHRSPRRSGMTCDTTSSAQNMCPCDMWHVMRHTKARDDPVVVCDM